MIIRDFGIANSSDGRVNSAAVSWEDQDYPDQELVLEIGDTVSERPQESRQPCVDAFLAACFPLAAVHGEARVRIDGQPCPMLVEGLYTAHAWWTSWGGMPFPMPLVETSSRKDRRIPSGPAPGRRVFIGRR